MYDEYGNPIQGGYQGGYHQGYEQQAEGIYHQGGIDYSSPPNFDRNWLKGLGFPANEVSVCENLFNQMMCTFGQPKFTVQFLQQCGYDYPTAQKLKYLYDIAQGKLSVDDTDDELIKHLKKLNGSKQRISMQHLPVSNIQDVPMLCLIIDVKDPTFAVYNSGEYTVNERFYRVMQATTTKVVIRTSRKPEIKFRGSKEVEGVAKVITEGVNPDGTIDVQFDPKYTLLCNRYIILVSIKRPEFHLGCYEIICLDGTRVYVFGRVLAAKHGLKYKGAQERVIDCGIFPNQLNQRITKAAAGVSNTLGGVKTNIFEATSAFELIYNPAAEFGSDDDADAMNIGEIDI